MSETMCNRIDEAQLAEAGKERVLPALTPADFADPDLIANCPIKRPAKSGRTQKYL
jgi:hypothetical protein